MNIGILEVHAVRRRVLAGAAALALVFAMAAAVVTARSAAAADGSILVDSITRNGCVVTIPIQVSESGEFSFTVADDGAQIFEDAFSAEEGEVVNVVWTIVNDVNQGAPGVGFYLDSADGSGLDSLDPWDFEGSDDIATACAASGGSDSGEGTEEPPAEEEPPVEEEAPEVTAAANVTVTEQAAPPSGAAQPVAATPAYTG